VESTPAIRTFGLPAWARGPAPFALAIVALGAYAAVTGGRISYVPMLVGVHIIAAVSLNIVNGMTGQFSIGHAGFMAVGAYTSAKVTLAMLTLKITGVPEGLSDQLMFLAATLIGGTTAALAGFLVGLPSLRLRGDYLAIVTLGFGEIIRVIATNTEALGGALGLQGLPERTSFFMVWGWVFLTVLVARRIASSAHGRSLWAIREDEIAAEAMGVNTTGYKVRSFVISSFFAGVAGALLAHQIQLVNPTTFSFMKSMEIVVMIVAGGLGSTTGAIVAAISLTLLPEAMRTAFKEIGGGDNSMAQKVDQIRMPIFGVLLVVLMLVRPQGLFGSREIWEMKWFRKVARS
jgi:branched-chain amino acid transport system permease protein